MARESELQRMVLDFFEETLGYRIRQPHLVSRGLLIRDDVIGFMRSNVNKKSYSRALKNYNGNSARMESSYCDALQSYLFQENYKRSDNKINVAIRLKEQYFKFEGEDFLLWHRSGSVVNDQFQENVFSIAEEVIYKPESEGPSRRVDLAMFLNGIFFSYAELKHLTQGQSAKDEGRKKIVANYAEAVDYFSVKQESDGSLPHLAMFERAIHIVSADSESVYMIRNMAAYRNMAETNAKARRGSYDLIHGHPEILKSFTLVPYENSYGLAIKNAFFEVYNKKSIEREILYYNFTQKNSKDGWRRTLVAPRPKQKFGVDKTIARVESLYRHEKDPDFAIKEISAKLKRTGLSEDVIATEARRYGALRNNSDMFSILKQYAPGFGKTNVMSWDALMLNELNDPNMRGHKLFDKVILLSDRLDLKSQMAQTMETMPTINKKAWGEADKVQDFIDMLMDPTMRIIIVNVQKFNFISERINARQRRQFKDMRIAFVIDEIHRSHNGDQNERMQETFDNSLSSFSEKKNLIVGLTATMPDNVLRRYGEISGVTSDGAVFEPFDMFSMNDAIKAGFILNPMDAFISVSVPIMIEEFDEFDVDNKYRAVSGKDVYNNKDYIHHVVDHAYKIIKRVTFNAIRKKGNVGVVGKAMYVADSIDAGIRAYRRFQKRLQEDNPCVPESELEVYIVYSKSSDQHHRSSPAELNHQRNEKKVIAAFKESKNGIIVVVDKLQTGFDEQTLHTSVLNTERRDISMVQTLCRVNRTSPGKRNCMVLDYSIVNDETGKSRNALNAEDAFAKFAGMNVSAMNVPATASKLATAYKNLMSDATYKRLFEAYKRSLGDAVYDTEEFIPLVKSLHEDEYKALVKKAREYSSLLNTASGVLSIEKKYQDGRIADCLSKANSILNKQRDVKLPLPFSVSEVEGFTAKEIENDLEDTEDESGDGSKGGSGSKGDDASQMKRLLEKIRKSNAFNELIETHIELVNESISMVIREINNAANGNSEFSISEGAKALANAVKDDRHGDHTDKFNKVFSSAMRLMKRRQEFVAFQDKVGRIGVDDGYKQLERLVKRMPEFYYEDMVDILVKKDNH